MNAKLYFFNSIDSNRPIECKYTTEIVGSVKYFVEQHDAILYMHDQGITQYQYLTKNYEEYKDPSKIMTYELWHVENRVGYVLHDYERYVNGNGEVRKRKAWIFRFVGYGRSCFSKTREELKEKVLHLIREYKKDANDVGLNIYPYYTRYYREKIRSDE